MFATRFGKFVHILFFSSTFCQFLVQSSTTEQRSPPIIFILFFRSPFYFYFLIDKDAIIYCSAKQASLISKITIFISKFCLCIKKRNTENKGIHNKVFEERKLYERVNNQLKHRWMDIS